MTIIDYMEVKCTFRILLSVPEEAVAIICIPWGWLSLCTLSVFLDLLCAFLDYIVLLGAINMFIYSKSQTILYELRILHIILKSILKTILCRERTR